MLNFNYVLVSVVFVRLEGYYWIKNVEYIWEIYMNDEDLILEFILNILVNFDIVIFILIVLLFVVLLGVVIFIVVKKKK